MNPGFLFFESGGKKSSSSRKFFEQDMGRRRVMKECKLTSEVFMLPHDTALDYKNCGCRLLQHTPKAHMRRCVLPFMRKSGREDKDIGSLVRIFRKNEWKMTSECTLT